MTKKKTTAVPISEELNQVETAETKSPEELQGETLEETLEEIPEETPEESKAKSKKPKAKSHPFRERADEIFASHPACDRLFFTADGTGFFEEQHARLHAGSIDKPEVETILRKEE